MSNTFHVLFQVKSAESERNAMLESNKNLAESNLSQEPVLNDLRIKVMELNDELKDLKESLESKKHKLGNRKSLYFWWSGKF